MNGTLHTHLEQRERERKVDSHRATRTNSKNLDTVQEFPKMIGSSLPKTRHNNTKKQKMFKPHCLTWDLSCFFFLNVCHIERKRASGWKRTDSHTCRSGRETSEWSGEEEGERQGPGEGRVGTWKAISQSSGMFLVHLTFFSFILLLPGTFLRFGFVYSF